MKDLLSTQKTKLDESEHDLFHILSKQPEILDSLVNMRRAKTEEEIAYRQNQGTLKLPLLTELIGLKQLNALL